jgi:translation initiation factor 6 (eIF-6)
LLLKIEKKEKIDIIDIENQINQLGNKKREGCILNRNLSSKKRELITNILELKLVKKDNLVNKSKR